MFEPLPDDSELVTRDDELQDEVRQALLEATGF